MKSTAAKAPVNDRVSILGIAGSLRRASYNHAALTAAQDLLPPDKSLQISDLEGLLLQSGPGERATRQS